MQHVGSGAIVVYTQEQQQEKEQGGDSDVNALEDGGGQNDSEGSLEMTEQGKGKAQETAAEGDDN